MRLRAAVLSSLLCLSCHEPAAETRRTASEALPPVPEISEPTPESTVTVEPRAASEPVRLRSRQLLVDGRPFLMRAVCWNPVRKGGQHPDGLLFRNPSSEDLRLIELDFQLMSAMGVNTLRTYEAIMNDQVLALVQKYKLHMIVPVFNFHATPWSDVEARVKKLKDHPATLVWEIGNEWNYNQFYSVGSTPIGMEAAKNLVKKAVSVVRGLDLRLPISTVYGELPTKELIAELSGIDIWGLNVYSGLSFGQRFETWKTLTDKPLYLAEYGADAINRTVLDESSQAQALVALSRELQMQASSLRSDNPVLGGAVFEWNDEWWKDAKGGAADHDVGGIAPGGGPFPDMVFNEEWWGLVDIDRKPRQVYQDLKKLWTTAADAEETF